MNDNNNHRPPLRFTVLTLNTHKGFNVFNRRFVLHELREAVRSLSADIVFLQEVLGEHQLHSRRNPGWPRIPQYEFLADTLWKDFAYGRNAVYPHGHHGNAVLSKFPIARFRNHDVSVGEREKRGLLHCVLTIPGQNLEVHAICVHFALFERSRRTQMDLMCRLIERAVPPEAPLLIAGDFNDWRVRAHRILRDCAGLREAFVSNIGKAARSFPVALPLLRLDRIYYRNLELTQPMVHSAPPWSRLSDHAALSAEVSL